MYVNMNIYVCLIVNVNTYVCLCVIVFYLQNKSDGVLLLVQTWEDSV